MGSYADQIWQNVPAMVEIWATGDMMSFRSRNGQICILLRIYIIRTLWDFQVRTETPLHADFRIWHCPDTLDMSYINQRSTPIIPYCCLLHLVHTCNHGPEGGMHCTVVAAVTCLALNQGSRKAQWLPFYDSCDKPDMCIGMGIGIGIEYRQCTACI